MPSVVKIHPHTRKRGCTNKGRYLTHQAALFAMHEMGRRTGASVARMSVYLCRTCAKPDGMGGKIYFYHYGHRWTEKS